MRQAEDPFTKSQNNGEGVLSIKQVSDSHFLPGAELLKAEVRLQGRYELRDHTF
jgi:hypothetical protein